MSLYFNIQGKEIPHSFVKVKQKKRKKTGKIVHDSHRVLNFLFQQLKVAYTTKSIH